MERLLALIRSKGWAVAAHNDYRQDGKRYTFWLFTKGTRALKGEGLTDLEALRQVTGQIAIHDSDGDCAKALEWLPQEGEYVSQALVEEALSRLRGTLGGPPPGQVNSLIDMIHDDRRCMFRSERST